VIRVLVAKDMRTLRDTLVAVLNRKDDIDVVGQVAVIPCSWWKRTHLAAQLLTIPVGTGS
jgi:hypothetical protein